MKFRIINYPCFVTASGESPVLAFNVQVKILWFWLTIRQYVCRTDNSYARMCAEELLEKLTENVCDD